ncbi:hypothetical protein BDV38DRAFT_244679 [Aspergillus pseudotamarii]|uniref:Uncharacterized protein n=1 Tax=Aspergillus pseudotamarii TaxID=132259 RepID=A0A5N6SUT9_ASPPS|nr:uncharacterized protein BDV38DRAFT_244679 [Aspergillus pseudotamarii]KAE8138448.1 hypothetical protein BDV38DRAFT_244679 [Aspergillus pseudotamarii]
MRPGSPTKCLLSEERRTGTDVRTGSEVFRRTGVRIRSSLAYGERKPVMIARTAAGSTEGPSSQGRLNRRIRIRQYNDNIKRKRWWRSAVSSPESNRNYD